MVNRVVPLAELRAATMKYARRLALIAPEALAAAKLAVNRGAEAAGFRNALQAGLDVCAPLYAATTEVGKRIRGNPQPRRTQGRAQLAARAVQGRTMIAVVRMSPSLSALWRAASRSTATAPCNAEEAPFFAGKSIQMVVGFDVGGGYDLYARTVARHWSRHIPGNPTFVPQNMPGAGTRTAANWLYNVAPKDGTAVGTIVQSAAVDQALGEPGIRFDAGKFNWIGNPIVDNLVTLS